MTFSSMIQNPYKILNHSLIRNMDDTLTPLEIEYLETLTPRERKAYEIAKSHLGMSFNLKRSNGYLTWLASRPKS
jgi:hypothetical protein